MADAETDLQIDECTAKVNMQLNTFSDRLEVPCNAEIEL